MDFLIDFFITLKIMPTWALKISFYMQTTHFLLNTMKESLFWTFKNTPNMIWFEYFSMSADHPKLRDFQKTLNS